MRHLDHGPKRVRAGKAFGEFVGDRRRLLAGELLESGQHARQLAPVDGRGLCGGALQDAGAERVELIAAESRGADRRRADSVGAQASGELAQAQLEVGERGVRHRPELFDGRIGGRRQQTSERERVEPPGRLRSRDRGRHASIRASRPTKPAGVRTTVTGDKSNPLAQVCDEFMPSRRNPWRSRSRYNVVRSTFASRAARDMLPAARATNLVTYSFSNVASTCSFAVW